jgi:hypothetical protein
MSMQFPAHIDTPAGRAVLVIGSTLGGGVPAYELPDTMVIPIDTRIPSDLQGRWYWMGPRLTLVVPPGACGISICACTFPPPLCYEQARQYEAAMGRVGTAVVQLTLF